ncbi:MAG: phytanoyl-CoA dioxygenase [Acidobacteria bacterium]|nr:phytanoyl-CoA dioxygenase [Acidobacteriota bacterium]MBI3426651.1 phytanoyl-CoA dioxygenase [Acidobacteriota bacterium]
MLTREQIKQFVADGFVRLDQAFSRALAERCCALLWADLGCDPADRSTWHQPVVWLGDYQQEPFVKAANTAVLHMAFEQLVGIGNWQPRGSLGTFPVRFPCDIPGGHDMGDTGWHIDASFPGADSDPNNYLTWRVNVHSRGRALLMLFLFSDVGELDAPTRIRCGSHLEVARLLAPAGEKGLAIRDLDLSATATCPETLATGQAGTVYLCHPFLTHAAQINRGSQPRFLAQPPLLLAQALAKGFELRGQQTAALVPVALAIRQALGQTNLDSD